MGAQLNIKDAETIRLARELAEMTGQPITKAIRTALEEAQGNRTRAAAALGMGRTTLWQKLKEYGL